MIELIDVREIKELEKIPKMKHARNLPLSEIDIWIQGLPKNRKYLFICHTNNRSKQAAEQLQEAGYDADYIEEGMGKYTGGDDCGPCQLIKKKSE